LTLSRKIISVYSENHTQPINGRNILLLIVKAGGAYSYHWTLRGQEKIQRKKVKLLKIQAL
jgi:hypothetical protein